jgi:hypothetical protein
VRHASSLGLVALLGSGCLRGSPEAQTPVAAASAPASSAAAPAAENEDRWKPYRLFSDAIGVREGIAAGLLRDGQTIEFTVSNPETGKPLDDATMTIGEGADAIVIRSDAKGHIAFPIRLDLVEKNPAVRLVSPSTPHPEFASNLQGTMRFHCDKEHGFQIDSRKPISPEELAAMRHEDVGNDRVWVAKEGITDAQVQAAGKHLVRLRAAYREATGWDPPPLHVLLAQEPRSLSVASAAGAPAVWPVSPAEIADRDRGTAFLVHEWTHATLAARSSSVPEPAQRWIEDGLCELVAYRVETRMFPRAKATRITSRTKELSLPEAPASFELIELDPPKATSMYGALAAMCEGVRVYGYGYAFAFWLAAIPDARGLPAALRELDTEPLLALAKKRAPKAFAELSIDRECAKKVIAGKPACAKG